MPRKKSRSGRLRRTPAAHPNARSATVEIHRGNEEQLRQQRDADHVAFSRAQTIEDKILMAILADRIESRLSPAQDGTSIEHVVARIRQIEMRLTVK